MRATFPTGEGLDAAGESAAAPTKSEADEGERKTALAGCFSLCAFFTPHHFARYSAAAIRVKITHASERAISSFGR